MSDITIVKTAGGYRAEYLGSTYYSSDGIGMWSNFNGETYPMTTIRSAVISQVIDPPTMPPPEHKTYTGDPADWERGEGGVFLQHGSYVPTIVLVDSDGDYTSLWRLRNGTIKVLNISNFIDIYENYYFRRIADTLADVFRDDLFKMKGVK